MLYRAILVILFLIALALTVNERTQEQRSQELAEAERPTIAGNPISPPNVGPSNTVGGTASGAYPGPPFVPPPTPTLARDVYPGPGATSAVPPFLPHRVRLRGDADLRAEPDSTAPPAQPISRLTAGVQAEAIGRRDGWYLLDTGVTRGWVPMEDVAEP